MATRTGDTVYGFRLLPTPDAPWYQHHQLELLDQALLLFAVWDAGGSDTLDFSG